jgi:CRP/FNR family transcriptional regulator, cyclic AMP receptor protein
VSEQQTTTSERIADRITAWSGTMAFLLLNASLFAIWIVANTLLPVLWHFDPYPFQFLTMAVSLEAIFLSVFVLISENRQAAADRRLMEHDAAINRKAEKDLQEIKHDLQFIKQQVAKVVVNE